MGSGGVAPPFLTSALVGDEWSDLRPSHFTPGERAHGTHWIGGWEDPSTGLDDVQKRKFLTLTGLELRPLGCPDCSQSLYRLHYPSSQKCHGGVRICYRHLKESILLSKPIYGDQQKNIKLNRSGTLWNKEIIKQCKRAIYRVHLE
jgi:hypothetical protein